MARLSSSATATDQIAYRSPFSKAAWGLIFVAGFVIVLIAGSTSVEAQSYITLCAVIGLIASLLIPFAAKRTPTITPRFLATALADVPCWGA